MAEQIKFGDRLFLKGEKVLLDNGSNDAIIESRNGTLVIKGNLTVDGTTTTVNTEVTTFSDPVLTLNADATGPTSPANEDVGFEVNRGDDPNVRFVWDETDDRWSFEDKDIYTTGTIYAGSLNISGGGLTYTNPEPMPVAVGGFDAGTTFDTVTFQDMFTGLLYPYQDPSFTSFSISGQTTILEVGDEITSGDYTFNWSTSNSVNVQTNSILIQDVTGSVTLASSQANDGNELLTLPSTITKTSASSHTWRISATNTQSSSFSRNFTVSWRWRTFYGTSSSTVLDESGVEALTNTSLSSNFTGNKSFAANDYKWMAYPTSFGLKTSFFDQATGFAVAMEPAYTLSITNAFGVSTDYYVHRTTYAIVGAITIGVS